MADSFRVVIFLIFLEVSAAHATKADLQLLCPEVREGYPATLSCYGDWESKVRWLFWNRRKSEVKRWGHIVECDEALGICRNQKDFMDVDSRRPNWFRTNLRLGSSHTAAKNRGDWYQCSVLVGSDLTERKTLSRQCRLQTYYLPKRPRCSVTVHRVGYPEDSEGDVKNVTVLCGPERVFPGMVCQLRLRWSYGSFSEVMWHNTPFKSTSTDITHKGYHYKNETCTASLLIQTPGYYQFSVKIQPRLDYEILHEVTGAMSKFTPTHKVFVSFRDPTVVVTAKRMEVCGATLLVTCYGLGFPTHPNFQWLINDEPKREILIRNSFADNSSRSEVRLQNVLPPDVVKISCTATLYSFSATKTINYNAPSPNGPVPKLEFLTYNREPTGPFLTLPNGTAGHFECRNSNPFSMVSDLQVRCREGQSIIVDRVKRVADENSGLDFVVSMSLGNNSIICTCKAIRREICYDKATVLTISNGEMPGPTGKSWGNRKLIEGSNLSESSSNSFLPGIIIGTSLSLMLLTAVSIYCFIKKRRAQRAYEYEDQAGPSEAPMQSSGQYENVRVLQERSSSRTGTVTIMTVDTVRHTEFDPYDIQQDVDDAERRCRVERSSISDHNGSSLRREVAPEQRFENSEETFVKQPRHVSRHSPSRSRREDNSAVSLHDDASREITSVKQPASTAYIWPSGRDETWVKQLARTPSASPRGSFRTQRKPSDIPEEPDEELEEQDGANGEQASLLLGPTRQQPVSQNHVRTNEKAKKGESQGHEIIMDQDSLGADSKDFSDSKESLDQTDGSDVCSNVAMMRPGQDCQE